jgi:integrase
LATRIQAGEIKPSSANKDLNHMGAVMKTVNTMKRLGLHLPLSDLNFKIEETDTRLPLSDKWIKEKILAEGALDGLNDEARCIVLLMVNTGARPSELAGLRSQDIYLTSNTPYIAIRPYDGHSLKNTIAKRDVPVTGISLEALLKFPDGFPRYAGSSASLSGIVNKYFRDSGLKETPNHTLYGLRHSFEDRMLAQPTMDERIRRDLMGHSLARQRYGLGATLKHANQLLQAKAI